MKAPQDKMTSGHVPPDGSAWLQAQRAMAERNDQSRRTARQAREESERVRAAEKAARERGRVYR